MSVKWKLAGGKTWKQKLHETHPNHGKVVSGKRGTLLIPKPLAVDAALRQVRKGKLITLSALRVRLARDTRAESACPMTTGIFMKVVAEAAEEALREGKQRVTPYWRAIRDDGRLNERFPGGARAQARRLREEGFAIEPGRGKQPPRVRDFESFTVD